MCLLIVVKYNNNKQGIIVCLMFYGRRKSFEYLTLIRHKVSASEIAKIK